MSNNVTDLLLSGDMRTIGKSNTIAAYILSNTEQFPALFAGLFHQNPGVRMRSSDVLEKVARVKPELFPPYADKLIALAKKSHQQEVQWHIAQIVTRIELYARQQSELLSIMADYYKQSQSNIVKAYSLTALTHLGLKLNRQGFVISILNSAENEASPSVKARAKILLKEIASSIS